MRVLSASITLVLGLGVVWAIETPVLAQIIPDETLGGERSRLTPNIPIRGDLADRIDGGAPRNTVLFHSFSEFNIDDSQRVYFSNPTGIESIVSRVTGTDVSDIMGTLGVDGNADLFLLNPNGIVFGADSSLDIAGSFVATTADRVTFADGHEFSALNPEGAPLLNISAPVGLQYGVGQSGAIINGGDLAVGPGQALTLAGETVVSTGSLTAEGGEVAIASISGAADIQLGDQGQILEIQSLDELLNPTRADAPSVPDILANTTAELGLTTTPAGEVILSASNTLIPTESGDTIVSGVVNAANLEEGQAGGRAVVVGDRVALIDNAQVTVAGDAGGGEALMGGDYQGQGSIPNARQTVMGANATINADAITTGDGGRVIVWGDEATRFDGSISVRGGNNAGNGGFVEISSLGTLDIRGEVDTTAVNGTVGTLLLDPTNILIVRADGNANENGNGNATLEDIDLFTDPNVGATDPTTGQPFAGTVINAAVLEHQPGNIVVEASNDIRVADGVSLNFVDPNGGLSEENTPPRSIRFTANADGVDGGNFRMDPTQRFTAKGSNLTISATSITLGPVDTTPYFSVTPQELADNPDQTVIGRRAGSVTLTATDGDILVGGALQLNLNPEVGPDERFRQTAIDTGAEIFNPPGTVNGFLFPFVFQGGGPITLAAPKGGITVDGDMRSVANIRGFLSGNGGQIEVTARDDIQINRDVRAYSYAGRGGAISLISERGVVNAAGLVDSVGLSGREVGGGGNILIIANRSNDPTINGHVTTGFIESISRTPIGRQPSGNVRIIANRGTVRTGDILTAQTINDAGAGGDSGEIRIEAPGGTVILDNVSYNAALEDSAGGAETAGISISADTIQLLNGASLNTSTLGSSAGGPIILDAQTITLADGSSINAGTVSKGAGGPIDIKAGAIALTNFSFLNTSTISDGNAGPISITTTTGDIALTDSSLFSLTAGKGNAGTISLDSADALRLNGNSVISTSVLLGADGVGGDITVNAPTGVFLQGSGLTTTEPPTGAQSDVTEVEPNEGLRFGDTGLIFDLPNLSQSVEGSFALVSDPNVAFSTEVPHVTISGQTGGDDLLDVYGFEVDTVGTQIIVDVDEAIANDSPDGLDLILRLYDKDRNLLLSNDNADVTLGSAGSVSDRDPYLVYVFNQPDTYFVELREADNTVVLDTPGSYSLNISRNDASLISSGITTQTRSSGRSGNITINAPLIDIQNGGQISSETLQTGPAGNISLSPPTGGPDLTITLAGAGSQITASTRDPVLRTPDFNRDNSGDSGDITINAPSSITIQGGCQWSDCPRNQ